MVRRCFAALLALVLVLLPSQAFAGRGTKVLYDKTSTTGATLDSGNLGTEVCDTLVVIVSAASAASGAVNAYVIDETKPASCPAAGCILFGTVASVPTATPDKSLSLGITSTAPVPRLYRVTAAAGGAGTVRLRIECAFSRA